jgi:hypothetical protein
MRGVHISSNGIYNSFKNSYIYLKNLNKSIFRTSWLQ